jgi:hypothetical protein
MARCGMPRPSKPRVPWPGLMAHLHRKHLRLVACCCLAMASWTGCVSDRPAPPRPAKAATGTGGIEEINLLAIPVALNLDDAPGVDGFVIKIFASNRKRPKPLLIESGQIEIMMFDGVPIAVPGAPPQPLRVWKYSAAELKRFATEGSIGTSYQIAQRWGDAKPSSTRISVVVRYTTPAGGSILSAPSIISAALK